MALGERRQLVIAGMADYNLVRDDNGSVGVSGYDWANYPGGKEQYERDQEHIRQWTKPKVKDAEWWRAYRKRKKQQNKLCPRCGLEVGRHEGKL